MTFCVSVVLEAERDADRIYSWIAQRSAVGAQRWYGEFLRALRGLESKADRCGRAPESDYVPFDIKQTFFKTPRGLRYRILFTISGIDVWVLHVRGPGQDLVSSEELRTS